MTTETKEPRIYTKGEVAIMVIAAGLSGIGATSLVTEAGKRFGAKKEAPDTAGVTIVELEALINKSIANNANAFRDKNGNEYVVDKQNRPVIFFGENVGTACKVVAARVVGYDIKGEPNSFERFPYETTVPHVTCPEPK